MTRKNCELVRIILKGFVVRPPFSYLSDNKRKKHQKIPYFLRAPEGVYVDKLDNILTRERTLKRVPVATVAGSENGRKHFVNTAEYTLSWMLCSLLTEPEMRGNALDKYYRMILI